MADTDTEAEAPETLLLEHPAPGHHDADLGEMTEAEAQSGRSFEKLIAGRASQKLLAPVGARTAVELRQAALVARALQPTGIRATVLDLSLALGWPPSEIERLTLGDVLYIGEARRRRRG